MQGMILPISQIRQIGASKLLVQHRNEFEYASRRIVLDSSWLEFVRQTSRESELPRPLTLRQNLALLSIRVNVTTAVEEIERGGGRRGFSGLVASSWLYKARPPVRYWIGRGQGRQFGDSPNTLLCATRLSLSLACALGAILWEWRNHKIDIKKSFPI